MILIEGAQMDLRQWDAVYPALARDFDVIRYDVRGFGRSDWVAGPYQHHADLLALMDLLGVERAHLVGLSLGGRIAIDLALTAPERVQSLVLSGPGLSGFEFDRNSFAELARARRTADAGRVAEAWLRHGYLEPAMRHASLAPRLRELAHANSAVWLRQDQELPLDPPAIERLDQVTHPTLLLMGELDEPDIHTIGLLLESQVPLLLRKDLADAGHLLPMERPEWFVGALRGFIEQTSPDPN